MPSGTSGGGIDTTSLLIAGGTGVAGALASYLSKKGDRKAEAAALQKTLEAKAASDRQSTALDESKLDPFRQQMFQANDLSSLDRLERATYSPVHLSAAPGYGASVPHLFGGASYEKSPELVSAAGALKRNIIGGNVAPSMTDPANYGKTAALNLARITNEGIDPATVSFRGIAPIDGAAESPGAPGVAAPGRYGYTPPDPNADLSAGFGENHATWAGAGKGALLGATVGPGAPIGAAVGAIAARTNTTKNDREKFAQSIGFTDTNALWQHLQQTLPQPVAAELQSRALTRIGKHDKTANAQWMNDVTAALAAAKSGGYAAPAGASLTGRG
jgi:hypothetical protein